MRYVDGYVLPLPKKNLAAYRRMAALASKVWIDHGALEYREAVAEDLRVHEGCGVSFPQGTGAKPGETVVFAWVVYRSRAHRDRVNAKVMQDPRLHASMKGPMPFDVSRMLYGGFEIVVAAAPRARRRKTSRRVTRRR